MQTQRFVYVLVRVPSDDIIAWLDQNIQLVCVQRGVKYLGCCQRSLSLIITFSDEIDSLGLFRAGLKPLGL